MITRMTQRTYIKLLFSGQAYHLKFFLLGLTMECPLEQRTSLCPFLQYKSGSLQDMVETVFALEEIDVERLLLYHEHCYEKSVN
jgi:hypothetical protein